MKLTKQKIDQFGDLLAQIGAGIKAAAALVVEIVNENPDGKRQLLEKYPQISMSFLNQLEAVGRGQLNPKLALTVNPGLVKLRKLPPSDQDRYLEEPLELVIEKDGEYDVLLVKAADMTADQAKQVFAEDHVRSHGAQRAYLEDLRQKAALANQTVPVKQVYTIHRNGQVEINGVLFHRKDLLDILSKLG